MFHSARILAMVLGLAASCYANAATYTITPGTQNVYTVSNGSFTDRFSFNVAGNTNLTATINEILNINTNNIALKLFNSSNVSLGSVTGTTGNALNFSSSSPLLAGNYYFQVTGQGIRGPNVPHSYSFATNGVSVSPVPEPETWAMMLGGLGLVASAARRKNALVNQGM